MRYIPLILTCLIVSTLGVSALSFAGTFAPSQELFRIADTDPSWEEIAIVAGVNPTSGDISTLRVVSGRDVLYSHNITRFAPGDQFSKSFITIENHSFYASRGGRLILWLDNESLPLDILRDKNQWIAQRGAKRVRKITAEVTRFLGIPTGINKNTPIQVQKNKLNLSDY